MDFPPVSKVGPEDPSPGQSTPTPHQSQAKQQPKPVSFILLRAKPIKYKVSCSRGLRMATLYHYSEAVTYQALVTQEKESRNCFFATKTPTFLFQWSNCPGLSHEPLKRPPNQNLTNPFVLRYSVATTFCSIDHPFTLIVIRIFVLFEVHFQQM